MINVIAGLIAIVLGVWGMKVWWWSFSELMRGLIPLLLIIGGLVAIAAGIGGVKELKNFKLKMDPEEEEDAPPQAK